MVWIGLAGWGWAEDATEGKVDFAREILPILSDKCFVCHGPDTQEEDGLRLDSFAAAVSDRGGYQAINPDAPEESELLSRIHSTDDPMPPVEAEKQLSEAERRLLTDWVKQGGSYAKHWAFVPPKKVAGRRTIDEFIGAKLQAAGVEFAPRASRAVLARRLALVLTGLPPDPQYLTEFLDDQSSNAYATLIERLFGSTSYGEHQARYWLDAVRYGDTHGSASR